MSDLLENVDPQLAAAMAGEAVRQAQDIELIASENYVSQPVMDAMGSVLTNKYAEGLPGRRYYGGCAESASSRPTRSTELSSDSESSSSSEESSASESGWT